MKTTQIASHTDDNPLNFEAVWESLRKTGRLIKELYETQKETERIAMENARQVEKLGGYCGGMFDLTVNPFLMKTF